MSLKVRVSSPISSCARGPESRGRTGPARCAAPPRRAPRSGAPGQRDAIGEIAEQQDDAEVAHEHAHHGGEHRGEGDLEGDLDGDLPVEDPSGAPRRRRGGWRVAYSRTWPGPAASTRSRGKAGSRADLVGRVDHVALRVDDQHRRAVHRALLGEQRRDARGLEDADQRPGAIGVDRERRRRDQHSRGIRIQHAQDRAVDTRERRRRPGARPVASPTTRRT